MNTPSKPQMILVAGPYRSGTGDDPQKMAENLKRLEAPSHALFKAGHVPMIGEWVALPVWSAEEGSPEPLGWAPIPRPSNPHNWSSCARRMARLSNRRARKWIAWRCSYVKRCWKQR